MLILAIDPGNIESGYALVDSEDCKPLEFGKEENGFLYSKFFKSLPRVDRVVIEMVASYGSAVGESVFMTCVAIGRFIQIFAEKGIACELVKRKRYITDLTGSSKANDAVIKQYLVDRFAPNASNYGKGSKKAPGWFYGFKADVWQAYAISVWYSDKVEHRVWV